MKKPRQGPSIYYASDKNIYDALNQSKVDNETVQKIFARRNIVCSKRTQREELSRFFSRLTHDYIDHQDISLRLGIKKRRERSTSIDLIGAIEKEEIFRAVESIKKELEADGDIVQITDDGNISLNIQYSEIDYKRSEFSQLQHKDGQIEIVKEAGRYLLRSTQSEYIDKVLDAIVINIRKECANEIKTRSINLTNAEVGTVSKFFYDLMSGLPGFARRDVTEVYVFKPKPTRTIEIKKDGGDQDEESDESHIERVFMKGNGVQQSELLQDLIGQRYYISKVAWISTETLGKGRGFDIEAMFSMPEDRSAFSYILRGIYELGDDARLSKIRRPPTLEEAKLIARVIEQKARELTESTRELAASSIVI